MLAVFVIVLGFVTAGFIATASSIFQNSNGTIEVSTDTPLNMAKGFLLCMFVGPYILAKNSALLWVENRIKLPTFGFCIIVVCIWSFCLGIVAVQTLVSLGVF